MIRVAVCRIAGRRPPFDPRRGTGPVFVKASVILGKKAIFFLKRLTRLVILGYSKPHRRLGRRGNAAKTVFLARDGL
jgi:hypothetical protein